MNSCYEELHEKLNSLIAQEESYWRKRAKILGLKDDNVNSRFFHSSITSRKASNVVHSLNYDDGVIVHNQKEKANVVISYINKLFQARNNCNFFLLVINIIPLCLSNFLQNNKIKLAFMWYWSRDYLS